MNQIDCCVPVNQPFGFYCDVCEKKIKRYNHLMPIKSRPFPFHCYVLHLFQPFLFKLESLNTTDDRHNNQYKKYLGNEISSLPNNTVLVKCTTATTHW